MLNVVQRAVFLFLALILTCEAFSNDFAAEHDMESYDEEELSQIIPYVENDKYIRHVHLMINAYEDDVARRRIVSETNALVDTKYKTYKRNGDLINSILALPKGLNDAGR
uniref:Pigment dispersing factor n=1 Tax=Helicoverpa armigera TaxID=29058 RepID=M4QCF8_HELAM|nr:pigment dispersing factor [Helicoverpa armigera]WGD18939.1 pigment dispersing factor [Helicoverpa armigera]